MTKEENNEVDKAVDELKDAATESYDKVRRHIAAEGGLGKAASGWWSTAKDKMSDGLEVLAGKPAAATIETTLKVATKGVKGAGKIIGSQVVKHSETTNLPKDAPAFAKILYGTGVLVQKGLGEATDAVKYVVSELKEPEAVPKLNRSKALLEDYIVGFDPAKGYGKKREDEGYSFTMGAKRDDKTQLAGQYTVKTENENSLLSITFDLDSKEDVFDRKKDLRSIVTQFVVVSSDLLNEEDDTELCGETDDEKYSFTAKRDGQTYSVEFKPNKIKGVTFSYTVTEDNKDE